MKLPYKFKKWPTWPQWKQFFKVLKKKEKIFFLGFFVSALFSFIFIVNHFYIENTKIIPRSGGTFREGVIGQPRFINPIYANSDADRDIVQLTFSGLMKYDDNMNIIPDLAKKYEVSNGGKTYTFYLRKNLFWQDGQPLTTDDIIFTIKTIQNPESKSPLLANWVGVKLKKIDSQTISFELEKPYSAFLENCTLKILPKHIWQKILAKDFPLETKQNLYPIGSGPYKLKEIKYDSSHYAKYVVLTKNPFYYGKKPNISKIIFYFFNNSKELEKIARHNEIDAFSTNFSPQLRNSWQSYFLEMPRYFAVFLNAEKENIFKDKDVRLALNYATNRKEIVEKVLNLKENSPYLGKEISQSPIMPKIYGFKSPKVIYKYDFEKSQELFKKAGFIKNKNGFWEKHISKENSFSFQKRLEKGSKGEEVKELQKCLSKLTDNGQKIYPSGEVSGYFGKKTEEAVIKFQEKYHKDILDPWGFKEGTGIIGKTTRQKLNEICFPSTKKVIPLSFTLTTVDQPNILKVANILKEQWRRAGINLEIESFPLSQLEEDFIRPRNYKALLLGEALGAIPDPLPFWHSSQTINPGLNLSLYKNKTVDDLLEKNRELANPKEREKVSETFQDIVLKDAPAVFLYSPDYIYNVSKRVKGIKIKKITKPSERFSNIENWYIKTKRIWK